jgi:putative ABC transport system ATP-binding protein
MTTTEPVIKVENVKKTFLIGVQEVEILKGVSFEAERSDFIIIFGASGSGKSTLLHTILGLEVPTSGKVTILGKDLYSGTNEDFRSKFRKENIGMIYQQPNWIKSITVLENVALPLSMMGIKKNEALLKASETLRNIGMGTWSHYIPTELSSGQQQKVALCRAIIGNAPVIIADEPTGNLDFKSGEDLMNQMLTLKRDNKTIIMVTHDLEYLKYANKAVQVADGLVVKVYNEKEIQEVSTEIKSKRNILVEGIQQ